MRKLTRNELRTIVLEVREFGIDPTKADVLLDTFKQEGWHGLGITIMDGSKSMRLVMPLKYEATLEQIQKQLARTYKEVRIAKEETSDGA